LSFACWVSGASFSLVDTVKFSSASSGATLITCSPATVTRGGSDCCARAGLDITEHTINATAVNPPVIVFEVKIDFFICMSFNVFLKMRSAEKIHKPVVNFRERAEKPRDNNANEINSGNKQSQQQRQKADDQAFTASGMLVFRDKFVEKTEILCIGFVEHVKNRPNQWNTSHKRVYQHMKDHFQNKPAAGAVAQGNEENDQRHPQGDHIAHKREQPNERVQSETEPGTGHTEGSVEQPGQPLC